MKLNFDLCRRAEIIQVGLNMNLYAKIKILVSLQKDIQHRNIVAEFEKMTC